MIDTCRTLSRDEREKLTDILTRMRDLNLDPTEFTCLKAVLLFGPGKFVFICPFICIYIIIPSLVQPLS